MTHTHINIFFDTESPSFEEDVPILVMKTTCEGQSMNIECSGGRIQIIRADLLRTRSLIMFVVVPIIFRVV